MSNLAESRAAGMRSVRVSMVVGASIVLGLGFAPPGALPMPHPAAHAQAPERLSPQQAAQLLRTADERRAGGVDHGVFTLRVRQLDLSDPSRPPNAATLRVYIEKATEKAGQLVIFEEPPSMRGYSFLVRANDTWIYRPDLRSPLRVSAQQRLFGDAGISEAAGIVFGAEYRVKEAAADVLDGVPTWRLALEATGASAPYPTATVWVGQADGLYRRAVLHSLSGMGLKQLDYEAWGEVSGRFTLVRMAVRDLLQAGRRTVTHIETVAIAERSIPARYFRPEFFTSAPLLLMGP